MNPAALFMVVSETVKAWPTFLPSVPEVRHIEPGTAKALDVRLGYGLALSWSLIVAAFVSSENNDSMKPLAMWALSATAMIGIYEVALHMRDLGSEL